MTLIKVKAEDKTKVFRILAMNGRFMGIYPNRFNITENSEEVIKEIKKQGIELL